MNPIAPDDSVVPMSRFDYLLVGGGLQSGLLALALRARQPGARIALLERSAALGGNHTWCFHDRDVPPDSRGWLAPLVVHRWPGYRVVFPGLERTISESYSAVTSERLHAVVSSSFVDQPESKLFLATEVRSVHPDRVRLGSGDELEATVVVDARGPVSPADAAPAGYQKFLGLELELGGPHGLDLPILMDATVDQSHGYRFIYVLPLDPRTLLVEDTYFHDSPELAEEQLRSEIRAYAIRRGWEVIGIRREEIGVLPMPWAGAFEAPQEGPLVAGYRGGWFHPGTGYSFPVALRLADFVASRPPTDLFGPDLARLARAHRLQRSFAQLLNRLLFRWYPPNVRRFIFERFYRLPEATIGNFYALRLRWRDGCRLLLGRPPPGISIRHRLRHGTSR